MARKILPGEIVVASHNAGKAREIKELLDTLRPGQYRVRSPADFALSEPEETEPTFVGNAKIKALAAATGSGLPALADDSGLCVDALGGRPGVHSARWAGPTRNFAAAVTLIEAELVRIGAKDPSARFVCALVIAWPDGHAEAFEGVVEGRLVFPPRGQRGFGYDPIFIPEGESLTFGEMNPERKHTLSHRADAFTKLMAACL